MRRVRIALRMALGGAVCCSFLGIFAGGLLAGFYGALVGDVSLGLDGALLGGSLGCLGGSVYGASLAFRKERSVDDPKPAPTSPPARRKKDRLRPRLTLPEEPSDAAGLEVRNILR
jgi:predicted lipid-binding transport protein (Tim44 family)